MASLSDPLVQELLSGRYVASLATENTDGSITSLRCGTGSMVRLYTSPRHRGAAKHGTFVPTPKFH